MLPISLLRGMGFFFGLILPQDLLHSELKRRLSPDGAGTAVGSISIHRTVLVSLALWNCFR
jgi:hypothetical protein